MWGGQNMHAEREGAFTGETSAPMARDAGAEFALVGNAPPHERRIEGPFGDHTGYYNSVETFPVFQVSAITMRRDPVYLPPFPGRPPDEPSPGGRTPG